MKEHCYFMHIIYIYIRRRDVHIGISCRMMLRPRRDADGMPQQDAAQPWRFFGPAGVNWKTSGCNGLFWAQF